MNPASLRAMARNTLHGNWGKMFMISIIFGFIISVTAIFPPFNLIILLPLTYGFTICGLQIARDKYVKIGTLFSGLKNFGQTFLVSVLMFIYTILWSFLLIIPGIVAGYSYRMAYHIMADNPDISTKEAITKSKLMMKGHKAELFMFDLSFIGWYILGSMPSGIGLLWVIPYHLTAIGHFYENLK